MRPESKFQNGNYLDTGMTKRRQIEIASIRHIGKEADNLEEQFYLGAQIECNIDYGIDRKEALRVIVKLKEAVREFGAREISRELLIPRARLSNILAGSFDNFDRRETAKSLADFQVKKTSHKLQKVKVRDYFEKEAANVGIQILAQRLKIDSANLSKMLAGRRPISEGAFRKGWKYLSKK